MSRVWRTCIIALMTASLALTSACGGNNGGGNQQGAGGGNGQGGGNNQGADQTRQQARTYQDRVGQPDRTMRMKTNSQNGTVRSSATETGLAMISIDGERYVSAERIAEALGYASEVDEETGELMIGGTDPLYRLKPGSAQAIAEDQPVNLDAPVMEKDGSLMIPVGALTRLFSEGMHYEIQQDRVVLHLIPEPDTANEQDLDFADDPQDPYKDEPVFAEPDAEPVLKNVNTASLLRYAKQYIGVKYKFGASPYSRSKRFDCSSFVQHVYGKFGVSMPRTSRSQAKKGSAISRKSLRRGDLLFFYVPGRFKTNKNVGHVGIYMGNKLMIHSSPEPDNGVQISNINHSYWKKTFLKARRVVY